MTAMTLNDMIQEVSQALTEALATPSEKRRRFVARSKTYATQAGEVLVNIEHSEGHWAGDAKVRTQLKLDGKVIAKPALLIALGEKKVRQENPIIKAAFLAKAPELADEWAKFIRDLYARVAETYKDRGHVPAYPESREPHWSSIRYILDGACKRVKVGSVIRPESALVMDEELLLRKAKAYGEEAALDWFRKTDAKLGDVTEIEVPHSRSGGHMVVTGKRVDRAIRLEQQRILKSSPKGKLFHQFPARIYVDGKFTPEAAYVRLFA